MSGVRTVLSFGHGAHEAEALGALADAAAAHDEAAAAAEGAYMATLDLCAKGSAVTVRRRRPPLLPRRRG